MKKIVQSNDIHHKIKTSILNFLNKIEFFEFRYIGDLSCLILFKERNDIPTTGLYTCGQEIIFSWNKNFIDNLSQEQVNFLIFHEISNLIKNSYSNDDFELTKNHALNMDIHYYPMDKDNNIEKITRTILEEKIKSFDAKSKEFIQNINRNTGEWSNLLELINKLNHPIIDMLSPIVVPDLFDKKSISLSNDTTQKSDIDFTVDSILLNQYDSITISRLELFNVIEEIEKIDIEKLNIEKINNLVCFFQKIDDIFISKYIRDVFCTVKKDNKESFQPCGEINVLINHNIQSNIEFIEKSQPKYEFPKTYAYLKHPVFSNSIHLYKKS